MVFHCLLVFIECHLKLGHLVWQNIRLWQEVEFMFSEFVSHPCVVQIQIVFASKLC